MLGQLLGSETRASILARLYPDPEVELHLNELIRQTGFSPRAVQQEVERLVEAGLLRERRSGNRRYLRAEVHHPAFRPLSDLVRVTAGAAGELKRVLDKDPRIRLALMFGSMAHGRERANSDIDLLVVADIGLRDLLTVLRPAQDALGRPINPVLMAPAEFRERQSSGEHFLTRVLESAPMVLVGSLDGDFARMARKPVVVPHKTSNDELAGLRAIVDRELHDASVEQISLDARLGMLYNAALKLAEIALRVNGYRAARERQHERTIGSLVMTLGEKWEPAMRLVDQIRVLRNRGDYESVGVATQAEVRDLRAEVELMLPAVRKVARDKGFKIS